MKDHGNERVIPDQGDDPIGRLAFTRLFGSPEQTPSGVWIHTVDMDGISHVVIEVSPESTYESLRAALPRAIDRRNFLLERKRIPDSTGSYLCQWDALQREGLTYRQIAESINHELAAKLYSHVVTVLGRWEREYREQLLFLSRHTEAKQQMHQRYMNQLHYQAWQVEDSLELSACKDILEVLRVHRDDANACLRDGLSRIAEGQAPFDPQTPVDLARVKYVLRLWRKRNGRKAK
jgi:hypothetical protein